MSDHIAIMNKSWKLIPKILSGQKTIESRWHQTRRVPWNAITVGDRVYFKNSGEKIIAQALVSKVLQFEIKNINDAKKIVSKYGKEMCLVNPNPRKWGRLPKYCVLVKLRKPRAVIQSFEINKKGFGSGTAWLMVDNIKKIVKK